MTSRFSGKNKEKKKGKRKIVLTKKKNKKKKKEGTRKQKTALPGVETGLSTRASNYLTTAPQ